MRWGRCWRRGAGDGEGGSTFIGGGLALRGLLLRPGGLGRRCRGRAGGHRRGHAFELHAVQPSSAQGSGLGRDARCRRCSTRHRRGWDSHFGCVFPSCGDPGLGVFRTCFEGRRTWGLDATTNTRVKILLLGGRGKAFRRFSRRDVGKSRSKGRASGRCRSRRGTPPTHTIRCYTSRPITSPQHPHTAPENSVGQAVVPGILFSWQSGVSL